MPTDEYAQAVHPIVSDSVQHNAKVCGDWILDLAYDRSLPTL